MNKANQQLEIAIAALHQFAECNLHEGNCASLEIASQRIQNVARVALAKMRRIEPLTPAQQEVLVDAQREAMDTALQAIRDGVGRLP